MNALKIYKLIHNTNDVKTLKKIFIYLQKNNGPMFLQKMAFKKIKDLYEL